MTATLDRLFRPRSIALVGATERSVWSNSAHGNLVRFGFPGAIHLVNRRGGTIYGREAATSCSAIGEPVDVALLMVPEAALLDTIADAGAAGIGAAVALSSGYAEMGEEGRARQQALAHAARAANVRLLGPNCLGFVNAGASVALWTTVLRKPLSARRIAIVSQSGAMAMQIGQFAFHQQVGLTHMISTGNEADIDIADGIDFLCDDPEVKVIALFMEAARRPAAFIAAVERATAAGKAIVVLKTGTCPAAAAAAAAHTGALVGDDRVFDAVCERLGMIRVHSIEDQVTTADVIARLGPVAPAGVGLVALSGGLCEIAIDEAARRGVPVPPLQHATVERLRAILPPFATPANPLDITGGAMIDRGLMTRSLAALAPDPAIGLTLFLLDGPVHEREAELSAAFLAPVGAGLAAGGKPSLMASPSFMPVTAATTAAAAKAGLTYSGAGLSHALAAIAALLRWSGRRAESAAPVRQVARVTDRPVGERAVLGYLGDRGVPVIEAIRATSADEAVAAARSIGGSVALKIASADIAHKTEVGGVALDVTGDEAVAAAYAKMLALVAAAAPRARIDGIEVAPMRRGGIELFVGTTRDPQWGPAIAVGFGGVLVELLGDTSLRLLPIGRDDALAMLDELRGAKLLDGYRGGAAANREALAEAIVAIGDAALALGDDLVSLEVNPLVVDGDRIEALDGLAVWAPSEHAA